MITHHRSHHTFIIGGSGGSGGSFRARPEAEPTEPTDAIHIHDIIIIINSPVARPCRIRVGGGGSFRARPEAETPFNAVMALLLSTCLDL